MRIDDQDRRRFFGQMATLGMGVGAALLSIRQAGAQETRPQAAPDRAPVSRPSPGRGPVGNPDVPLEVLFLGTGSPGIGVSAALLPIEKADTTQATLIRFPRSRWIWLFVLKCVLCPLRLATGAEAGREETVNPIWATVVQHIEERLPYVEDRDLYLQRREGVVVLAKRLKEMGYAYNFGSDWKFLAAIERHDDEAATRDTNGKNLVRWLKEDMGFEVDPHAHLTTHNYADVACLIEELGVKPSPVANGFLYTEDWDQMRAPIRGWERPDYEWQCQALWGGATPGHAGNEYYVSGLWRPKSPQEFFTHDPNGNLISLGHWRIAQDVIDLVEKMRKGELQPADGMFTGAIGAGERHLVVGSKDQKTLFDELESLVPYTREGRIAWAGLSQQVEIWKNRYGEKPTCYRIPFRPPVGSAAEAKAKGAKPESKR